MLLFVFFTMWWYFCFGKGSAYSFRTWMEHSWVQRFVLLTVHRSLPAVHVITLILTEWRYGTGVISSGAGLPLFFPHSRPSIQLRRPACGCVLMMSVYSWEESSIWPWPLENKMSIKPPIFPEYQVTQFGLGGKSNGEIVSATAGCLWLMNMRTRGLVYI